MSDTMQFQEAVYQAVEQQAERADKEAQSTNLPVLRLLTLDDLKKIPPLEWLVEKHIPQNALCEVFGASGDGKSFIALDMACAVATGTDWLNFKTERGVVIYVAAEGVNGMEKRVNAWRNSHSGDPTPNLLFFDDGLQIGEEDAVERVINTANQLPVLPSLIVLDTRARCTVGKEENSAKDMGVFVQGCERIRKATGSTVLIVHHSGKNGDARGSTTVKAACDTQLKVVMAKNAKTKRPNIKITCEKQKNFAPFEAVTVELVPDAPSDSCFLQSCNGDGATNFKEFDGQEEKLLSGIALAMTDKGLELKNIKALKAIECEQRALIYKLNALIEEGRLVKRGRRYFLPE